MKLVLDTNVLVSGLLWDGPPAQILDRVDDGIDKLFISRPLLAELAAVLSRPKFAAAFRRFDHDPTELMATVVTHAVIIEAKPLTGAVIRADPADDQILACAATADADYIVTGDKHLLRIDRFHGVAIRTPAAYLREASDR